MSVCVHTAILKETVMNLGHIGEWPGRSYKDKVKMIQMYSSLQFSEAELWCLEEKGEKYEGKVNRSWTNLNNCSSGRKSQQYSLAFAYYSTQLTWLHRLDSHGCSEIYNLHPINEKSQILEKNVCKVQIDKITQFNAPI